MRPLRETGLTLDEVRELPAAINVSTAARALGISRASAYMSISEGTFPVATIPVGSRIRVLTASLIDLLEGRRRTGGQAA